MRSSKLESGFQDRLIKRLENILPGCLIFKMDQRQGIPDLLVLHNKGWLSLECKRSLTAPHQPNQDYYVSMMNEMSYSRFVCPENIDTILEEIENEFQ